MHSMRSLTRPTAYKLGLIALGLLTAHPAVLEAAFDNVKQVAVAPLSDGRLELWVANQQGQLFTTWETTLGPNAGWAPVTDFLGSGGGLPGTLPAGVIDVAVAPLGDARLELWATTANGQVLTTWKTTTNADADWAPWSNFLASGSGLPGPLPAGMIVIDIAVAPLSDQRLELWATTSTGQVFTTWKTTTDPNADWAPWTSFLASGGGLPGTLPTDVVDVAVAPLPDARLELWATTAGGQVFTSWKATTHPDADWVPWWNFMAAGSGLPGTLPDGVRRIGVAPLSDGRLELWVTTATGQMFTTWKATTHPDADWVPWWNFLASSNGLPGPLPAGAIDLAVAPLSDKRLEVWAATATGQLFTTWKVTTHPDADWAPWVEFLAAPDTFTLIGVPPSQAGLMVDGADLNGRVEDRTAPAPAGSPPLFSVGALSSSPLGNEAVGYGIAWNVAPTIFPTSWTNASDDLQGTLVREIWLPITVWVVKGPFAAESVRARQALVDASAIYWKEGAGVNFIPIDVRDATTSRGATTHQDVLDATNLNTLPSQIGSVNGRMNLYWVNTVNGGTGNGSQPAGQPFAAVGFTASAGLVAHEIGHALVLEHVDPTLFNNENVMQGNGGARLFLTEGQTFRIHFHPSSMLVFAYRARPNEPQRVCSRDTASAECPRNDKRLWADGRLPPN